jgi:hypothetical protein
VESVWPFARITFIQVCPFSVRTLQHIALLIAHHVGFTLTNGKKGTGKTVSLANAHGLSSIHKHVAQDGTYSQHRLSIQDKTDSPAQKKMLHRDYYPVA